MYSRRCGGRGRLVAGPDLPLPGSPNGDSRQRTALRFIECPCPVPVGLGTDCSRYFCERDECEQTTGPRHGHECGKAVPVDSVEFVVNCYERTYRGVLRPGFVQGLAAQQHYSFAGISVLVNNVDDRRDAELRAADCGADRVVFVQDRLQEALRRTGLVRRRHLRRLQHFTDCCLVAVTLEGPEWLCYWDADAALHEPTDWLSPALKYAHTHPEIAVMNPNNWHLELAEREALQIDGDMAIGYGFSDVAFLARRSEFAQPVYRYFAPAAWRYPLAHVEPIFEQRVDAYMRRTGRLRATYLPAVVTHPDRVGLNYPPTGVREWLRRWVFRVVARALRPSQHPAVRAWPSL